jgi:hypothetical protein
VAEWACLPALRVRRTQLKADIEAKSEQLEKERERAAELIA